MSGPVIDERVALLLPDGGDPKPDAVAGRIDRESVGLAEVGGQHTRPFGRPSARPDGAEARPGRPPGIRVATRRGEVDEVVPAVNEGVPDRVGLL